MVCAASYCIMVLHGWGHCLRMSGLSTLPSIPREQVISVAVLGFPPSLTKTQRSLLLSPQPESFPTGMQEALVLSFFFPVVLFFFLCSPSILLSPPSFPPLFLVASLRFAPDQRLSFAAISLKALAACLNWHPRGCGFACPALAAASTECVLCSPTAGLDACHLSWTHSEYEGEAENDWKRVDMFVVLEKYSKTKVFLEYFFQSCFGL